MHPSAAIGADCFSLRGRTSTAAPVPPGGTPQQTDPECSSAAGSCTTIEASRLHVNSVRQLVRLLRSQCVSTGAAFHSAAELGVPIRACHGLPCRHTRPLQPLHPGNSWALGDHVKHGVTNGTGCMQTCQAVKAGAGAGWCEERQGQQGWGADLRARQDGWRVSRGVRGAMRQEVCCQDGNMQRMAGCQDGRLVGEWGWVRGGWAAAWQRRQRLGSLRQWRLWFRVLTFERRARALPNCRNSKLLWLWHNCAAAAASLLLQLCCCCRAGRLVARHADSKLVHCWRDAVTGRYTVAPRQQGAAGSSRQWRPVGAQSLGSVASHRATCRPLATLLADGLHLWISRPMDVHLQSGRQQQQTGMGRRCMWLE